MKSIRIFTSNTDLLGEISNYESLFFVRSFSGIGDLELRINRYKSYTETLQKGNVIVVGNDKHKAYIILHKEIELNQDGKVSENWLIKALELKAVVGQRITLPPSHTAYDSRQASAESVMKHYVNRNVISPTDANRKISQLILASDSNRGSTVSWQSRFKNVAEELAEISLVSGTGWNVRVDYALKKWVFDSLEGNNRSVNQIINSPVIFSPQFENVQDMQYVDSDLNYRNTAYIAGQGEGIERRVVELGQATGLARKEIFVDARDIAEETEDEVPVLRPPAEVIDDLMNRGEQKLAELIQETFLEATITTPILSTNIERKTTMLTQFQPLEYVDVDRRYNSAFTYEKDWDLGDIVTVQNKAWGVTLDARITEVRETYEPSGFKLEVTFGQSRPTLINKIRQELSQISMEIRR